MLMRPLDDPSPEDQQTRARWARRIAVVYGCGLLLLILFVAAQRLTGESQQTAGGAQAQGQSTLHMDRAPLTR